MDDDNFIPIQVNGPPSSSSGSLPQSAGYNNSYGYPNNSTFVPSNGYNNYYNNNNNYNPPNNSAGGYGMNNQQQWYQNPSTLESFPKSGIDLATQGIRLMNDPSLLTDGVQNESKRFYHSVQPYFNVKKSYVLSKLKLLLFPFLHKSWYRQKGNSDQYLPPDLDINAPDLYIPLMAFVTYVLLVGYFMGTRFKFTPDVLGTTSSTAIGVVCFEVILLKLGTILWNLPPISLLELLAYNGYKFVGITINIILGIIFGYYGFLITFFCTSISLCFFTYNNLKSVISGGGGGGADDDNLTLFKKYVLFGVGALQVLTTFFLCYLDFNNDK